MPFYGVIVSSQQVNRKEVREMKSRQEIGQELRELRGEKTREEVALAVGVTASSITMYEVGERVPRDEVKVALANYYGKSVGALFFGE